MKEFAIILILMAAGTVLSGQTLEWLWAVKAGGQNGDQCFDIATDITGNSYITGLIEGQGPGSGSSHFGSISLEYAGLTDIFVAKLDEGGNWLWAVSAGSSGYDVGYGIALDTAENCYVTGYFSGTVTFGTTTLTSNGYADIFAAKLDTNGNWLWAIRAGGESANEEDIGFDICTDANGDSYVTGNIIGSADFGIHQWNVVVGSDPFVAKIDTNGNWLWANAPFGLGIEDRGCGVSVDNNGNCYLTGIFSNTINFGTIMLTNLGLYDGYIAKLSSSGNWLWAKMINGTNGNDGVYVATDNQGNSYVTGSFKTMAVFDSITINITPNYINTDVYIAKINSGGNWLWAKRAGGSHYDKSKSICIDSNGNCYVTGFCNETAGFGNTVLGYNGGSSLVFVTKLDASGNWQWAEGCSGTIEDIGFGVADDRSQGVMLAGRFSETATFGNLSITSTGWIYSWDIFVARLSSENNIPPEVTAGSILNQAYPNPFRKGEMSLIKVEVVTNDSGSLNVYNLKGQCLESHHISSGTQYIHINSSGMTAGIYLYNLKTRTANITRKMVLLK